MTTPRVAVPEPSSMNDAYRDRSWPTYARAIEFAGGVAVCIPLGESQAGMARIASSCAAILLPGSDADVDPEKYGEQATPECGKKDPAREAADDLLLQDAFNLHKPILGICYGLQSLNVWRSGTLIQDLEKLRPESKVNHRAGSKILEAHPVTIANDSRLAGIFGDASDLRRTDGSLSLSVNSSHHQAVAVPGDQLEIVALSPQDNVIEALESRLADLFVIGVQWHPERTVDTSPASRALFRAFVEAARAWKPRAIRESVLQSSQGRS